MSNEALYWVGLGAGLVGLAIIVYLGHRRRQRASEDRVSLVTIGLAVSLSGLTAWCAGRLGLDPEDGKWFFFGVIGLVQASLSHPHDKPLTSLPQWFAGGLEYAATLLLLTGQAPGAGVAALAAAFLIHVREWEYERARRRRVMLQRISHALRTPAAAIRSLADALAGPALADPEQRAHFVSLIAGEADRLGTGINRLLRLARGEPEPAAERVPVDLTEWAHATAERWRTRLGSLRVVAPDKLWAEIDPDKLDEAVEALLDNALRYGGGGVELAVAETAAGVEVSVKDGGTGLSEAARKRLEAIEAAPDLLPAEDSSVQGFGLGLWAASQVARAHGGKLTVDPPSRITLSFPTKA